MIGNEGASEGGCTTWIELSVLFDVGGYRSKDDRAEADEKARRRAETKHAVRARKERRCIQKVRFREELTRFKRAVRYIVTSELDRMQPPMSKAEQCQAFKGFAFVGLFGHQTDAKSWCLMTEDEKVTVDDAT